MLTANFAMMLGVGLIMTALVVVFFSPYRQWLGFMFAGMVFWGSVEILRLVVQQVTEWPTLYAYLTAMSVMMLGLIYILLRLDATEQRDISSRSLIEHTPIYDDER
ncbi:AciT family ciprofloxacin tolerance protein [Acinetobacter rathckeae]|uniref:AciT family ciprofloxacin tolerance protein n=1 Tax=Acinetobacter rathckeae TaxID=2605272 RepID=UPI0018A2DDE9|nr:AciT family ciprofloxacin tolerance protein [Acinetobacter rathckeae]MBF7688193.1 hypothetical protein [Acinetobacter rathckeae]MBF7695288.1 hypothetical protein [Acinetobacter rathckeae]